jgi:hypothetical protein
VAATSHEPGYDGPVTDPTLAPDPSPPPDAQAPGERRLARPPSDRYRAAEAAAAAASAATRDPAASVMRGVAVAAGIVLAGAAAIVALGGVLAVSAGLVVAALAIGWAVAQGLRVGAREHLDRGRRQRVALVFALLAVLLGQAGLWLYARAEGGVLAPPDYLWQVFGPLVPLQLAGAAVTAWISAR